MTRNLYLIELRFSDGKWRQEGNLCNSQGDAEVSARHLSDLWGAAEARVREVARRCTDDGKFAPISDKIGKVSAYI